MSRTELTSKVRELKELKIMADELQAEITAIEDAIKAENLQFYTQLMRFSPKTPLTRQGESETSL